MAAACGAGDLVSDLVSGPRLGVQRVIQPAAKRGYLAAEEVEAPAVTWLLKKVEA